MLMWTILKGKTLLDVVSSAARITLRAQGQRSSPSQPDGPGSPHPSCPQGRSRVWTARLADLPGQSSKSFRQREAHRRGPGTEWTGLWGLGACPGSSSLHGCRTRTGCLCHPPKSLYLEATCLPRQACLFGAQSCKPLPPLLLPSQGHPGEHRGDVTYCGRSPCQDISRSQSLPWGSPTGPGTWAGVPLHQAEDKGNGGDPRALSHGAHWQPQALGSAFPSLVVPQVAWRPGTGLDAWASPPH